jgi:predicted ATP-grasp superfamily ATP-dependent carboligase
VSQGAEYNIFSKPKLKKPTMIVVWSEEASNIGIRTADYMINDLKFSEFAEILPEGFFPMAGVNVVDDVAQFPESKFYASNDSKIVILKSSIPRMDWHRFLTVLLDFAKKECGVSAIYTVGAMISLSAHTTPRLLVSVVNNNDMKSELEKLEVTCNTDYENPQGQKPTLSSYLIWIARQKEINAATIWVPVPYYMVSTEDPRASKRIVSFFNSKFNLGVDFALFDSDIAAQNSKIGDLYARSPDIANLVQKLESGQSLESEDSDKLVREMTDQLKNNYQV